jgi:hypothetical protein
MSYEARESQILAEFSATHVKRSQKNYIKPPANTPTNFSKNLPLINYEIDKLAEKMREDCFAQNKSSEEIICEFFASTEKLRGAA